MKRFLRIFITALLLINIGILPLSKVLAASNNLVSNPSVETPDPSNSSVPLNWAQGNWGVNNTAFSYIKGNAEDGSDSLKVQLNSYSSGDAKWYFLPVNVVSGNKYSYSDYYISNVSSEIVAQYQTAAGALSYQDFGSTSASSVWKQYTNSFTIPANVTQLTIFHLINSVGSLQTDNFSLVQTSVPAVTITSPTTNSTISGNTTLSANATDVSGIASVQFMVDGLAIGNPIIASPYQYVWDSTSATNGSHNITAVATNLSGASSTSSPINVNVNNMNSSGNLIPNPLVNTVNPLNPALPSNWSEDNWGVNTVKFNYLSTGHNTSRSLKVKLTSYTSGDAKWSFDPITAVQDQQYKFSEYYESNVNTEVDVGFNMSDGTTVYQIIGLPSSSGTWAHFATQFSVPLGTQTFTIYHILNKVGALTTSDFSLTKYTPVGFSRPLLSLTFDDGYVNEYTQAMPLLQKYGFTSTQFIITDLLNTSGYLSDSQLIGLYQAGNEIASHTVTHNDLTQESNAQILSEMTTSQSSLQSIIGTPVTDLAYPYGLYNNSVVADTKAVYSAARGVEDGLNSKDSYNAYDIKAQNVYNTTSTAQIADWVAQAQATNTWLVLVYHSVDPDTAKGIYNVTPAQLDQQLSVIKSSGVTVDTMKQAVTEITPQL